MIFLRAISPRRLFRTICAEYSSRPMYRHALYTTLRENTAPDDVSRSRSIMAGPETGTSSLHKTMAPDDGKTARQNPFCLMVQR